MAEASKQHFPKVEVTLTPSSGGRFDVIVDGKLVYSKHETGRFPELNEALDLIEQA